MKKRDTADGDSTPADKTNRDTADGSSTHGDYPLTIAYEDLVKGKTVRGQPLADEVPHEHQGRKTLQGPGKPESSREGVHLR